MVLFYEQSAKKLFLATTLGSISNVLLCAILIPSFGIFGSIAAEFLAMALRIAILLFIAKKFVIVKTNDFKLYIMVIFAILASALGFLLTYSSNGIRLESIIIKCVIWIVLSSVEILIGLPEIKKFFSTTNNLNKESKVE
jgi:O-antigen/teichoic acid export membrane protein